MGEYASFDDLTTDVTVDEEDVTLANGLKVKLKGLTRFEYTLSLKSANNGGQVDMVQLETSLIRYGMCQPKLTKEQAEHWMKTSPAGIIGPILDTIRRLSNLVDDAEKSDVS